MDWDTSVLLTQISIVGFIAFVLLDYHYARFVKKKGKIMEFNKSTGFGVLPSRYYGRVDKYWVPLEKEEYETYALQLRPIVSITFWEGRVTKFTYLPKISQNKKK